MKIFINKDSNYYRPVLYSLALIENNQEIQFEYVDISTSADIVIDHNHTESEVIATAFYDQLGDRKPELQYHKVFSKPQLICNQNGLVDLLATIFYMVNCLQEYTATSNGLDQYGRITYASSYQNQYQSVEKNLVQEYIELWLAQHQISFQSEKSKVFLSHDIDSLHTAVIPISVQVIRQIPPLDLLQILVQKLLGRPNIESLNQVMKINDEHDIQSTFFWLMNKGIGQHSIPNADYRFDPKYLALTRNRNNANALHKSSHTTTLDQEFDAAKFDSPANRYHYLAHQPLRDWQVISDSQIELDASLGYAEKMGFRNSYGQAFQPFNLNQNQPYDFVEVPLHIMDTTFERYQQMDPKTISDEIIDFIDRNKFNCTLSILWHNQHFNKYDIGPYLHIYKEILGYLFEEQIKHTTPQEIIQKRKLKWIRS
ncbi:MAG: hypothetical protein KJP00_14050 [Bacteroidia bacterium]|nr:hypothetical protein [Bacteroidia bacterium]